jgi:hypothetical protein
MMMKMMMMVMHDAGRAWNEPDFGYWVSQHSKTAPCNNYTNVSSTWHWVQTVLQSATSGPVWASKAHTLFTHNEGRANRGFGPRRCRHRNSKNTEAHTQSQTYHTSENDHQPATNTLMTVTSMPPHHLIQCQHMLLGWATPQDLGENNLVTTVMLSSMYLAGNYENS